MMKVELVLSEEEAQDFFAWRRVRKSEDDAFGTAVQGLNEKPFRGKFVKPKVRKAYNGKHRAWTAEDSQDLHKSYERWFHNGQMKPGKINALARRLRRTPAAVRQRAYELGLTKKGTIPAHGEHELTYVGPKKAVRAPPTRENVWTPEEIAYLKANYWAMTYSELRKTLKRSQGAISSKVSTLGLARKQKQEHERSKEVTVEKTLSSFPVFKTLGEFSSLFELVAKHVIANKGRMTYEGDGYNLGLSSKREWREFVEEFAHLAPKVCDYFGAEHGFHIERVNNDLTIRYG